MQFTPVLKGLLVGCIGFLAIIVVVNLLLGETSGAGRMMMPLLFGLYAFLFIGRANFASVKCPACAAQQPLWRKPLSLRQLMWGGWTCPDCSADIDRHGRAIDVKPAEH